MWTIGCVLLMAFLLIGGVLLGVQPQLAAASAATQQRATVAASNAGQAAVLEQLKSDFDGIDVLKAELKPLTASVPSGTRMPALVNQIDALAGATQVTLDGLTFSEASPYTPVEAPAADAEPATEAESSPEPVPAPAPPTAGVPPITSAQITATNFASLAITVTVTGSYGNALNFVHGLQMGERLFLVTGLTTTAQASAEGESSTEDVTATISGLVYVLVPPAGEAAAPAAG